jgi:hypothetical protein
MRTPIVIKSQNSDPSGPLPACELDVFTRNPDGSLGGRLPVCSLQVNVRGNELVMATVELEPVALNIENVQADLFTTIDGQRYRLVPV